MAIGATSLTGKFRGHVASACALDAHNWLLPVAYAVLEGESNESWTWFMQRLREVIGHPKGLVIHTGACEGLENDVDAVFPRVEHRECMRHLATNFTKKFKGKIFEEDLWRSAYTYIPSTHATYLQNMYVVPKVKKYLEEHHTKLWARSKFGELSKVDFVCNNLAESFNDKISGMKTLGIVILLDAIRQCIMVKIDLRQRICARNFLGHKIVPKVVMLLNARTRAMRTIKMRMVRSSRTLAEVYAEYKRGSERRYTVDIGNKTCSCRQWQITGLPCHHAIYFILKLRGNGAEIENYVDNYFSVDKFAATYAENVPPMADENDWEIVDPGFKLQPPVLRRPPGRPRKLRIEASTDKGSRLGARKRKCKRCGRFGHIKRLCKNPVTHDIVPVHTPVAENEASQPELAEEQLEDGDEHSEENVRKQPIYEEVEVPARKGCEKKQKGKRNREERANNGGVLEYEEVAGVIEDVLEDLSANCRRNNKSLPISSLYDSPDER